MGGSFCIHGASNIFARTGVWRVVESSADIQGLKAYLYDSVGVACFSSESEITEAVSMEES